MGLGKASKSVPFKKPSHGDTEIRHNTSLDKSRGDDTGVDEMFAISPYLTREWGPGKGLTFCTIHEAPTVATES